MLPLKRHSLKGIQSFFLKIYFYVLLPLFQPVVLPLFLVVRTSNEKTGKYVTDGKPYTLSDLSRGQRKSVVFIDSLLIPEFSNKINIYS